MRVNRICILLLILVGAGCTPDVATPTTQLLFPTTPGSYWTHQTVYFLLGPNDTTSVIRDSMVIVSSVPDAAGMPVLTLVVVSTRSRQETIMLRVGERRLETQIADSIHRGWITIADLDSSRWTLYDTTITLTINGMPESIRLHGEGIFTGDDSVQTASGGFAAKRYTIAHDRYHIGVNSVTQVESLYHMRDTMTYVLVPTIGFCEMTKGLMYVQHPLGTPIYVNAYGFHRQLMGYDITPGS